MAATDDRKEWMGVLAKAPAARLAALWQELGRSAVPEPEFEWLRAPQAGGVMVRGRMGGTGSAFNIGEMTVTRAALQLATGEVGHACVQGRDKAKARIAAICDALMQTDSAAAVTTGILDPLRAEAAAGRAALAAKAATTKVDFFTMVRGED